MADETENLTIRLLRDIQRTLASHGAELTSLREEVGGLRGEMGQFRGEIRAEIDTLRKDLRAAINQQHAVLANNGALIDNIDERLRALEAGRLKG